MVAFSNYWENLMLKHYFNIESGATADLYLGLSSHNPTDDSSGVSEPPSHKGYQRFKTTNGSGTSWEFQAIATGVTVTSGTTIDFNRASIPWGTMSYFGLFNGNTSGASVCAYGALGTAIDVEAYDIVRFGAGKVNIGHSQREERLTGSAISKTQVSANLEKVSGTKELAGTAIAVTLISTALSTTFVWEDTEGFEFEDTSGFEWKDI